MKLVELEISNIRGVKHLKLIQNGKNFVVYGPNGSGKSTVVDAIDFLLTGQIKRLTGEGTGQLSLKKHGPHIDHKPEEAIVRGLIKIQGLDDPIEIERCMERPRRLLYDKSLESYLKPILELAKRGHYILTRKEILNYITSNPSNRAQQIQDLLNLNEIEIIRKKLVKISNKFKNEYDSVKNSLELSKKGLFEAVNIEIYEEKKIIDFINYNRLILGGNSISELTIEEIKLNLYPPSIKSEQYIQDPKFLIKTIETLIINLDIKNQKRFEEIENELTKSIGKLKSILINIKDVKKLELIKLGLELIEPTGDCPLCKVPWEAGTLEMYLTKRLSEINELNKILNRIKNNAQELKLITSNFLKGVNNIIENRKKISIKDISKFQSWMKKLREFFALIDQPLENVVKMDFKPYDLKKILFPDNIYKDLEQIRTNFDIDSFKLTPDQAAWDNLTKLVENLKIYFLTIENLKLKKEVYKRAEILKENYLNARDKVLRNLYDTIRERFEELYKKIHGLDEDQFKSNLKPDGAGITFEVDFYGKGNFPPLALHSEGHQDSMGICLYLALAEKVNEGLMNLIILDDVVMSIDSGHRRSICNILKSFFPHFQFLITTHDKTWMNQLKTEKMIIKNNVVEFYNWNIKTGPKHNILETNIWVSIYDYLNKRDIPNAAFTLRRGLEQIFSKICDNLRVNVVYKINGRYELSNFLSPAISTYKKLLKKAKNSAHSWGKEEEYEELNTQSSIASQIFSRTYAEQWTVNTAVHYNNWADFSLNDFKPVVEAFEDLCQLFLCNDCGEYIQLLKDSNMQDVSVSCDCGGFNWILTKK